jgi:hypothetical protein
MQFPNLNAGLYQVRVTARDAKTGRVGSALHWIEVPEAKPEGLSMSSIFLSASVPGSAGASQKPVLKPDQRFPKSRRVRFQTYVYATSATSPTNLVLEAQLIRDGQTVIATPPSVVSTEGVTDLTRIPVIGEFPLDSFPVGPYELKLTVTDLRSKKTASQQVNFTVK